MNLQPRCSPDQGTELKNQGMVTRKSGMSNTGMDMQLLVGQDVLFFYFFIFLFF